MKKKKVCLVHHCIEPPYLGGLCKTHAEEDRAKARRRDDAIEALRDGRIDKALPSDSAIREELDRLCVWWRDACQLLHYSIPHPVLLKNEAEAAKSWCVELAQELVDAERAIRAGETISTTLLDYTRKSVWKRFDNLERGLMSNGVERPK